MVLFFKDKIREDINLNAGSTTEHYKENRDSLFILDLKICRLGVPGKTPSGS